MSKKQRWFGEDDAKETTDKYIQRCPRNATGKAKKVPKKRHSNRENKDQETTDIQSKIRCLRNDPHRHNENSNRKYDYDVYISHHPYNYPCM